MTKGKEDLRDFIKLSVFEAFDEAEKKIDTLCQKNVKIALQGHELDCPGRTSKIKSIINWSAFGGVFGLVIEKIINLSGK